MSGRRWSSRRFVVSIGRCGTLRCSPVGAGLPVGSAWSARVNIPRGLEADAARLTRLAQWAAGSVGWPA